VLSVEQRERLRHDLVDMARADERITAGAEVGSLTQTTGDRWSDLDLTFGVGVGHRVDDVLRDWTARLERERGAVRLSGEVHAEIASPRRHFSSSPRGRTATTGRRTCGENRLGPRCVSVSRTVATSAS